ncbi:MAG: hypothetical protein NTW52_02420 [Planctomycetota bacterium]|nr:hypothetical protein [Planctomycetota bacterium]
MKFKQILNRCLLHTELTHESYLRAGGWEKLVRERKLGDMV